MGKYINLTGKVRGRLTIIERDLSVKKGKGIHWVCRCSCGTTLSINSSVLGWKKSCGCQNTEMRSKNAKNMGKKNKQNLNERFFKYVNKLPFGKKCWEWVGDIGIGGYGRFWYKGKTNFAHRISYIKHKGKIPKGILVCHTCDNPKCVNPNHLFLGTNQNNYDDMLNKKRKKPRRNYHRLSENQVKEIKNKLQQNYLVQDLAIEYNMNVQSISAIKNNKTWKNI